MAILTKEAISKVKDLVTEDVEVPEWGGTVRVKMMTAQERDVYELSIYEDEQNNRSENVRARLCVSVMIDEKGNRIFGLNEVKVLGKKSAKAVNRVFEVARKLNAIGDDEVKEIEKNLPETPGGDSSSG